MDLNLLLQGTIAALSPANLMAAFIGLLYGTVLGALPGITAAVGVALVIPLTYSMPFETAMIMMMATFKGGKYGGSIAAVLLNIPGDPPAAATVLDGYPMAKKGQGGKALQAALLSSFTGEMFSSIVAVLVSVQLASLALKVGPAEYTVIILLALTTIGSLAGKSVIKGLISGVFGVMVAMIGTDPMTGLPRFAFDVLELSSGINFLTFLIGILSIPPLLDMLREGKMQELYALPAADKKEGKLNRSDLRRMAMPSLIGSVIGTIVGVIPALGGGTAAFLSYDFVKRTSKHPEKFGTGIIEGVAAPESANNATNGGGIVALLALGIPGTVGMAVLMGAFYIHGLSPGPELFRNNMGMVATIFAGMFTANFLMLTFYPMMGLLAKIVVMRKSLLVPLIFLFTLIGVYSIDNSVWDIWMMLLFGVVGYVMAVYRFSAVTAVIGFILGPILEGNMRRALIISQGDFGIFFGSGLSQAMWVLTAISLATIFWQQWRTAMGRGAKAFTARGDDE